MITLIVVQIKSIQITFIYIVFTKQPEVDHSALQKFKADPTISMSQYK